MAEGEHSDQNCNMYDVVLIKLYSERFNFKEISGKPKSKPKIMDKSVVHVVLLW